MGLYEAVWVVWGLYGVLWGCVGYRGLYGIVGGCRGLCVFAWGCVGCMGTVCFYVVVWAVGDILGL